MARRKRRARNAGKPFSSENYNIKTVHEDREYGLYWYAWLWKILRPALIFLCSFLVVTGIVAMGYQRVYDHYLAPVDALNAQTVSFTIENGSTVSQVGDQLVKANLLKNATIFRYIIQLRGLTDSLSYGTFKLSPSMNVTDIITELTSGSQNNERVITIIPGWTCEDIADYLYDIGAIEEKQTFLTLCRDADSFVNSSYGLRNAVETSATLSQRKYALEGYLAPDTYRIFLSANEQSILNTLLLQDNTVIDSVFYGGTEYYRDDSGTYREVDTFKSDLTMDEVIILASMVEKEAANNEDYARVAAVFYNRLNAGMRLESDPTATYLTRDNKLILTDEEIQDDNAYNTYRVSGLPAGPICNPSKAALTAARNPDMTFIEEGYLYFCAAEPESGALVFAKTLEAHEANVARYRPSWEAYQNAKVDQTEE